MEPNSAYLVTMNDVYIAMRLARRRGIKSGQSFQKELEEVLAKHKKKAKYLGSRNDVDMIVGNLREEGFYKGTKILHIKSSEAKNE